MNSRVVIGWEALGALLGNASKATLARYIEKGKIPPPRDLTTHRPIWITDEIMAALRNLPAREVKREARP